MFVIVVPAATRCSFDRMTCLGQFKCVSHTCVFFTRPWSSFREAFTPPSDISHTGSIKPVRDMASFVRWHCDECSFDLCNGIVAKTHHPHPLAKVEPRSPDVYGPKATWTCNRCWKWNPEAISYHCAACKYDLCSNCYFACAHPLHVHPLVLTEGSVCYPEAMYRGMWRCDHCQKTSTLMADQRPYHCSKCKFDLCQTCFKGRKSHLHKHELKLAEGQAVYPSYKGRWICDSCKRINSYPLSLSLPISARARDNF